MTGLTTALPPGAADVFTRAVNTVASRSSKDSLIALVVGVVIAVWSASGGMAALEMGLDIAYEVPSDRKFLARRVMATPLMLATIIFGGTASALIVSGSPLARGYRVTWACRAPRSSLSGRSSAGWPRSCCSACCSCYYSWGPNRETPWWRWLSTGGLAEIVIFLAASVGFSFYVTKFGTYGKTYGAFAGVIILIFWLYLTGIAVLLGAEFSAGTEREATAQSQ